MFKLLKALNPSKNKPISWVEISFLSLKAPKQLGFVNVRIEHFDAFMNKNKVRIILKIIVSLLEYETNIHILIIIIIIKELKNYLAKKIIINNNNNKNKSNNFIAKEHEHRFAKLFI